MIAEKNKGAGKKRKEKKKEKVKDRYMTVFRNKNASKDGVQLAYPWTFLPPFRLGNSIPTPTTMLQLQPLPLPLPTHDGSFFSLHQSYTSSYTVAAVIRGRRERRNNLRIEIVQKAREGSGRLWKVMFNSARLEAGGGERADAGSNHSPTYSSMAGALNLASPCAYYLIGSKGSQTLTQPA